MDKKTFIKKIAIWVAVIAAVIIAVIGLGWGHVIEGNLFKEVTKWIVVGLGVIVILEAFIYLAIGPLLWHWKEKKENGNKD